jgi:hypothetical protein
MRAPQHREDAELGDVRGAAELFDHQVVFVAGEAEFFGQGQRAWRKRVKGHGGRISLCRLRGQLALPSRWRNAALSGRQLDKPAPRLYLGA